MRGPRLRAAPQPPSPHQHLPELFFLINPAAARAAASSGLMASLTRHRRIDAASRLPAHALQDAAPLRQRRHWLRRQVGPWWVRGDRGGGQCRTPPGCQGPSRSLGAKCRPHPAAPGPLGSRALPCPAVGAALPGNAVGPRGLRLHSSAPALPLPKLWGTTRGGATASNAPQALPPAPPPQPAGPGTQGAGHPVTGPALPDGAKLMEELGTGLSSPCQPSLVPCSGAPSLAQPGLPGAPFTPLQHCQLPPCWAVGLGAGLGSGCSFPGSALSAAAALGGRGRQEPQPPPSSQQWMGLEG